MKGTEMYDAIAHIDEDLVDRVVAEGPVHPAVTKAGFNWKTVLPYAALAAVAIVMIGVISLLHIGSEKPVPISDPTAVPTASPTAEPTVSPTEQDALPDIEFKGFRDLIELPVHALQYGESAGEEGVVGCLLDPAMNIGPAQLEAISDDEFLVLDQVNRQLIFAKLDGTTKTVSLSMCDRPKAIAYSEEGIAVLDSENIVIINENGVVERTVALPEEQHNDGWNYGGVGLFEYVNGRLYWQTNSDKTYVLEGNELNETEKLRSVSILNGKATVGENGRVWNVEVWNSPITPVKTQNDALLALTSGGELPDTLLTAGLCYADNGPFAEAPVERDDFICTPLFTMSPTERVYMLTCYEDQAVIWELIFGPKEDTSVTVPEGYDENDYTLLRAFFENADAGSVKNGEKLFPNYDPADPTTWIDEDPYRYNSVTWNAQGRVYGLSFRGTDDAPIELVGKLDLDLFDALNGVNSWNVIFEEIATDDLPVTAKQNNACFQFPMVNGEARFTGGYVERLYLLSATHVFCDITGEAKSDLSVLPSFKIDVTVEGLGYAGVSAYGDENYYEVHLNATPAKGGSFIGWFDADGKLVSTDENYTLFGEDSGVDAEGAHAEHAFTARFDSGEVMDDAAKLAAFFELTDENGVRNGEKLFENYDPANKSTWKNPHKYPAVLIWDANGNLTSLDITAFTDVNETCELAGELELTGFAELTNLKIQDSVTVRSITVSDCPKLDNFTAGGKYEELHFFAAQPPQQYFSFYAKKLIECRFTEMEDVVLTSADAACKPAFWGFKNQNDTAVRLCIGCSPSDPYTFDGWYTANGELYSAEGTISFAENEPPAGGDWVLSPRSKDKEPYYKPYEGELPTASDMIVSLENGVPARFDLDFDGLEDTVTASMTEYHGIYDREFAVEIILGSKPNEPFTYSIRGSSDLFAVYVIDCDISDDRLDVIFSAGGDMAEDIESLHAFRVDPTGENILDITTDQAGILDINYEYGNGRIFTGSDGLFADRGVFDPREGVPVMVWTDLLDTQGIVGRFTVTNEGLRLISPFSFYPDGPETREYKTLKRSMEVTVMNDGVPGEKITLKKGQTIAAYQTDMWSWIDFILEDGRIVRAELDTRYAGFRINGIDQDKYCENHYAG